MPNSADPSDGAADARVRCAWLPAGDALYRRYHDEEWGVPVHEDARLLELLILEGAQAGLSWITVLRKRERYRVRLHGFDPQRLAACTPADIDDWMQDAGLIRHRGKLESAIANARACCAVQAACGSFAAYLWDWVGGEPIRNRPPTLAGVPARTELSTRLSRDLLRRGFRFVGPTTVYAFMQAAGLVDDHTRDCFRCAPVAAP